MKRDVHTVASDVTLPDLEKAFVDRKVGGFPVLDKGRLVGIVSRSDIVRQLVLEHSVAEIPDYYFDEAGFYFDEAGFHEVPLTSQAQARLLPERNPRRDRPQIKLRCEFCLQSET